jgi:hypothetical protein
VAPLPAARPQLPARSKHAPAAAPLPVGSFVGGITASLTRLRAPCQGYREEGQGDTRRLRMGAASSRGISPLALRHPAVTAVRRLAGESLASL